VALPSRLSSVGSVDSREHDYRYCACADCLTNGGQSLVVGYAERDFGHRVRRRGHDRVTVNLRMRARFAWHARRRPDRVASSPFNPVILAEGREPSPRGRGDGDGYGPAGSDERFNELVMNVFQTACGRTHQTKRSSRSHTARQRTASAITREERAPALTGDLR